MPSLFAKVKAKMDLYAHEKVRSLLDGKINKGGLKITYNAVFYELFLILDIIKIKILLIKLKYKS